MHRRDSYVARNRSVGPLFRLGAPRASLEVAGILEGWNAAGAILVFFKKFRFI
jgi:hypothetical protein